MSESNPTNTALGFAKLLLISAVILLAAFALMTVLNYITR